MTSNSVEPTTVEDLRAVVQSQNRMLAGAFALCTRMEVAMNQTFANYEQVGARLADFEVKMARVCASNRAYQLEVLKLRMDLVYAQSKLYDLQGSVEVLERHSAP